MSIKRLLLIVAAVAISATVFPVHTLAAADQTIATLSLGIGTTYATATADTVMVIIPSGCTAVRIWTANASLATFVRFYSTTEVSGSTITYKPIPRDAAHSGSSWYFALMNSPTDLHGWNEYGGLKSVDRLTLKSGTGVTGAWTVEVRK